MSQSLESEINEAYRRWKFCEEQGNHTAARKWSDRWVELSAQRRGQQPVKAVEVRSAADEDAQVAAVVKMSLRKARYDGLRF